MIDREAVHKGTGVSYMIPSDEGGAVYGVAEVDANHAPGI